MIQYFEGNYILCMTSCYLLPLIRSMSRYCSTTFSVTVQSVNNAFFLEMWTVMLSEILKLCPWIWEYGREFARHNYEWMNIKQSLCLCCFLSMCFPRIPMIWRHDKVNRQRRSRATSRHFFYHTWYVQHLVSERLLSLISKE